MRREASLVLSIALIACPSAARADDRSDASSQATADALFKEARQLMTAGRYGEACPKLAESQRLDPAAGTLLNLAECFEKNGQTASAWATFGEAARAAELRRRADWKATADARKRDLEPSLSYLILEVDPDTANAPDLSITRDGVDVRRAAWSTPIPVDPGSHTLAATAPGRDPWKTTVDVKQPKARVVVRVPRLVPRLAAAIEKPKTPEDATHDGARKTAGLIVAGVGVAGIAAGAIFGLLASDQASTADERCPSSPCADREGLDANDKAHSFATVSTIALVAGGVLVATGITLWLWPSSGARAKGPALRLSGSGAVLSGEF